MLEALIGERAEDDEVPDLEKFSLQDVLGALQELKEEIAGMSNDKARRKAAARVALGLVGRINLALCNVLHTLLCSTTPHDTLDGYTMSLEDEVPVF